MTAAIASDERALEALQSWFFERVTGRRGAEPERDRRLVVGGTLPVEARIDVYRHGYVARLVACLADDYPAVAHALGDAHFDRVCREYIAREPPSSPSLNDYGARFVEFLATRELPGGSFVPELARLEWALVEAIHAEVPGSLNPGALRQVSESDWPRLRLTPSPSLRLLRSSYPLQRYYQAFVQEQRPGLPACEASAVAICRRADEVWRLPIELRHLPLLERLHAGAPLASALAALESSGASADDAAAVQRAFGDWVASGMFSGFALG